jgi:predicted nucleic acid-binding protein
VPSGMSGSDLLVDTNIIILTLGGSLRLAEYVEGRRLFVSVITEIEALGYPGLTLSGRKQIEAYINRCAALGLSDEVKKKTIGIRAQYKMKIPDAIIAATALTFGLTLLTADMGFAKLGAITEVDLLSH